jgi:hypothetical protein
MQPQIGSPRSDLEGRPSQKGKREREAGRRKSESKLTSELCQSDIAFLPFSHASPIPERESTSLLFFFPPSGGG